MRLECLVRLEILRLYEPLSLLRRGMKKIQLLIGIASILALSACNTLSDPTSGVSPESRRPKTPRPPVSTNPGSNTSVSTQCSSNGATTTCIITINGVTQVRTYEGNVSVNVVNDVVQILRNGQVIDEIRPGTSPQPPVTPEPPVVTPPTPPVPPVVTPPPPGSNDSTSVDCSSDGVTSTCQITINGVAQTRVYEGNVSTSVVNGVVQILRDGQVIDEIRP
jgi:hypothetical protein